MTEVMERGPAMTPTIVRRVVPGAIEVMDRKTADGKLALCVFWSVEHARRDMYALGCYPEDGWKAVERNDEQLALLFDLFAMMGERRMVYVEPAPGAPELSALMEPADFIEMLRESPEK